MRGRAVRSRGSVSSASTWISMRGGRRGGRTLCASGPGGGGGGGHPGGGLGGGGGGNKLDAVSNGRLFVWPVAHRGSWRTAWRWRLPLPRLSAPDRQCFRGAGTLRRPV